MVNRIVCLALVSFLTMNACAQTDTLASVKKQPVYNIKPWLDVPLALAGTGWTLYGFSKIYGRDEVPEADILALDRNNVNKFDRPVTDNYSIKAKEASDKFFYGSMGLPLVLLFDNKIRKDALRVGILYLEAMAITGTLYTTAAMSANRYRPYAYNESVSMEQRTRGGAKNSFFAGHVALVGTSTFFIARTLSDYHPDMKNKWILFSVAGLATATTGYLRMEAGQHFKTDVLLGAAIGTLSGILVPGVHKNKSTDPRLTLTPLVGMSNGFTAFYKINR